MKLHCKKKNSEIIRALDKNGKNITLKGWNSGKVEKEMEREKKKQN